MGGSSKSSRTTSERPGSCELSWFFPLQQGQEAENSHEPGGSDVDRELSREPAMFQIGQRRKKRTRPPPKENIWGAFLASKKSFPGRWWIQKPIKSGKTISTTEIFPLWPPFFRQSSELEQGGVCFLSSQLDCRERC